jgi:hypothetical protein
MSLTSTPDASDEYCIALAMLHGCLFRDGGTDTFPLYYVKAEEESFVAHPIEAEHHRLTGYYGFHSRAAMARAYCKHYNLI